MDIDLTSFEIMCLAAALNSAAMLENDDFDLLERRFEQKYEVTEKALGEGTYGKVYRAVSKQNGQAEALHSWRHMMKGTISTYIYIK